MQQRCRCKGRTACGDQGKINLTVAGDQQTYTNCLQKREPPQDLLINLVPSNSAVTVAGWNPRKHHKLSMSKTWLRGYTNRMNYQVACEIEETNPCSFPSFFPILQDFCRITEKVFLSENDENDPTSPPGEDLFAPPSLAITQKKLEKKTWRTEQTQLPKPFPPIFEFFFFFRIFVDSTSQLHRSFIIALGIEDWDQLGELGLTSPQRSLDLTSGDGFLFFRLVVDQLSQLETNQGNV